jgi:hypothetical protein
MGRLTGERRALAAAILALYGFLYLIVAMNPPAPEWMACFAGMALVYGAGFFSVVAGYFWARWYAIGLGMSGLITAVFSMFQIGMEPILMFYGITHGAVSLILWGTGMSATFDGRKEWRERFHLDENATHKLGKSIIRLGISLPYVVLWALAPKEGAGGAVLALVAGGVAASGIIGILRMRGWGVLALAGGAVALAISLYGESVASGGGIVTFERGYALNVGAAGVAGLVLIAAALVPFARPLAAYLRERG